MSTSRPRRVGAFAAAALISVLGLAACGSDDGDGDAAATNASGVSTITQGKAQGLHAPLLQAVRAQGGRQGRRLRRRPHGPRRQEGSGSSRRSSTSSSRRSPPVLPSQPRSATPPTARRRSPTSARRPSCSPTRTSRPPRRSSSRRTRGSPTSPASRARRLGVQTDTTGQSLRRGQQGRQRLHPRRVRGPADAGSRVSCPVASKAPSTTTAPCSTTSRTTRRPRSSRSSRPARSTASCSRLNDPNGQKAADAANEALKAAQADGTYNTIYKKWFGVDAPK